MSNKPKVAFICIHNSCRSQIAEALGKYFAGDIFETAQKQNTKSIKTLCA